jgi:hypothetical protein
MAMVINTILFKLDGNAYYSPEFGRGGLRAVFACMATHVAGSGTLDIDIEHRNSDDTTFTSAGTFTQITAVGSSTEEVSGLKEIIRLKFTVGGVGIGSAVAYIMPPPQWFPV